MAILIINKEDFSERLKDFNITCKKCKSNKVELVVNWAAYPSCAWFGIDVICTDCKHGEEILYV